VLISLLSFLLAWRSGLWSKKRTTKNVLFFTELDKNSFPKSLSQMKKYFMDKMRM